jgi:sortase A
MATTDVPPWTEAEPAVATAPCRTRYDEREPVDAEPSAEMGEGAPQEHPARGTAAARARRRDRLIAGSAWVRNIGVLVILFAAWQLWGTTIQEQHGQDDLARQFASKVHHPRPGFTLLPATANVPGPAAGGVVALLQIPKIGLEKFVAEGTDTEQLNIAPGHYTGTAQPGQAGNVAVAGHRTTHGAPFNRLAELAPGDPIYLTDLEGQRLTYIVAFPPFTVSPSNVSVLNYFGDDRLTLTTCNPEFSASERLVVVAGFKGGPGQVSNLRHAKGGHPYNVATAGEAGWDVSLLPVVFLEVALLVLLGLTNRRWSGYLPRESKWLILVPIWVALIFLLFGTLSNFLPAAV